MPVQVSAARTADSVAGERRAFVRYPINLKVLADPLAVEAVHWSGDLRDISAGGVSLLLSRRCEIGMELVIELPDLASASMVAARVVHVAPAPGGRWLTGCQLLDLLSAEDLSSLRRR